MFVFKKHVLAKMIKPAGMRTCKYLYLLIFFMVSDFK